MHRLFKAGSVAALVLLAGCQRPDAVREVASASQPLVLRIQQSGSDLERRMAAQRESARARADRQMELAEAARARVDAYERVWRFGDNERLAKQLTILQERDAALREDPLGKVTAAARDSGTPTAIDLSSLKKTLAGLDRLRGAERMGRDDWIAFAQAARDELGKVETEAAGGTEGPPAPASETP